MDLLGLTALLGDDRPRDPRAAAATSSPVFRVASLVAGDSLLVVLRGDVDVAAEAALQALAPAVAACGLPVAVDASGVTFIDCTGLRAVLDLGRSAPGLTLRRTSAAVELVLRLTGVTDDDLGRSGADAGSPPPR